MSTAAQDGRTRRRMISANLGWAQQQDGDGRAAITTLERAVHTAHDTGDLRTARWPALGSRSC